MKKTGPTTIVIFGASGDLTKRKLVPALFHSYRKDRLPAEFRIVGFARRPWDDQTFRQLLKEALQQFDPTDFDDTVWQAFAERLTYFQGDLDIAEDFARLKQQLASLEAQPSNRLYYLATAPDFFVPIVQNLGQADMARIASAEEATLSTAEHWCRLVVEKPFGTDFASAEALNEAIHAVFAEHQVYRMDHYLGKETAQNILYFRFANAIFEPIWNRNYVDNVQISVLERVAIERRAGYYDEAGVMRDMFQNHLLQLLSLVAMEPPTSFAADSVRDERAKLFQAIRPLALSDTVRAQYDGYRQAEGVAAQSQTPTYAALKLYIDNWRWQGVPFYMRSGKALGRKNSEILIQFKEPPHLMFPDIADDAFKPNILSMCIQPDEGILLQFEAKVPDSHDTQSVNMAFNYRSTFKRASLPDAYERLLLDAIRGDASLFTRSDGIREAWRLVDPIIHGWEQDVPQVPPLATYAVGSDGPIEADQLLAHDGRVWQRGCLAE